MASARKDQNPKALAGRGGKSPWPTGARWRVWECCAPLGVAQLKSWLPGKAEAGGDPVSKARAIGRQAASVHHKSPGRRFFYPACCGWLGIGQPRMHLGLVDLSQTPSGTSPPGRSEGPTLPRKWGTHIGKTGFCRLCMIWPQKHKERFYESPESESAFFFVYRRLRSTYADLALKL